MENTDTQSENTATQAEEEKELLTVDEVCDRLRIHRSTLHRHLAGKAGAVSADLRQLQQRKVGGKLFFTRQSVNEFLYGKEQKTQ